MVLELTYLLLHLETQWCLGGGFGVLQLLLGGWPFPCCVSLREVLRRAVLFPSGTGHKIFAVILREGK